MKHQRRDDFGARATLEVGGRSLVYYRLGKLEEDGIAPVSRLPYSIKVLLESMLRNNDGFAVSKQDVINMAQWNPAAPADIEVPFKPARVILQDFTGVPAVVDLAAMRSAMAQLGGDAQRINPLVPVDLVIDHSVQVDQFGSRMALFFNAEREFERNQERYEFLKWGQKAFSRFSVVPPETGIVHQVNLEYLAKVVQVYDEEEGALVALPDSLVGTDSHTTMINGLGVVGWGVGGIEAEAVMLGQPIYMLLPEVVGFKLTGRLPEGATATDLALTVTELLRKKGVVNRFVEFYGPGASTMTLADRATIANMAPEYGATVGFFPIDAETLNFLRATGRPEEQVQLVEAYAKAQGLFMEPEAADALYTDLVELDLGTVVPSVAGPKRPQDRVQLTMHKQAFEKALTAPIAERGFALAGDALQRKAVVQDNGSTSTIGHGAVVIAAITSCTNTSNPSVMVGAGLLAKKAVERGLTTPKHVKTSLAPGSRVVTSYLEQAGLMPPLEALGFHTVGYGCTSCIAVGTPVLMGNGTARRIEQLPGAGGALVFGPNAGGKLALARQAELMDQGVRECIALVLQDGRELICTPDHQILCADGRWVRADELVIGRDRVVVGLEAPLDEPAADEQGYLLAAGAFQFRLDVAQERSQALAFARLLGHLLGDGSISVAGQGRFNVGQAVDREMALNDIELLTGKRPAANQYDERKWSIALPQELTNAISTLEGVRVGRRIDQAPGLPAFILDPACPLALVREYLGGAFGADGHAPGLHRLGEGEDNAVLQHPAYSQSAKPEHVTALKVVMAQMIDLLARCGVATEGSKVYEYDVRHAESSYPAAEEPRVEVRLSLTDGLSFVEKVGFRYCVDKMLRASAAVVYWRMIKGIDRQRLWMSSRLEQMHHEQPAWSFRQAQALAATELTERETAIFPHYSLLQGADRFDRLPKPADRSFRPLHRESCEFPSPAALLTQLGVRDWFAPLLARGEGQQAKRYCVDKNALELPTFSLGVLDRRSVGARPVFDIAVDDIHAFVAGSVSVHNCIGNSGPIPTPVAEAVQESELVAAAVLSGNRNFEGRINPLVKASYLMSPPLVVAYALAGTVDIDLINDPLGKDQQGQPVYLRDIWPSQQEIQDEMHRSLKPEMFVDQYANVFAGNDAWNSIKIPEGSLYAWNGDSTYIQHPPFFQNLTPQPAPIGDIRGARALALLGDSVTTDHISPAGSIAINSPAGQYLIEHGVEPKEFNSYGARRGNHEVMMRGTFANIRLKNQLVPGVEGGVTIHLPTGEQTSIYDASMRYQQAGTPLIILAGKEYGTGSSRDWAAKGTYLLGVKAVIAETYERIHRSNLVGMGVLPLQFKPGDTWAELGLKGDEEYTIVGINEELKPRQELVVHAQRASGSIVTFNVIVRIDTPVEIDYYKNGGILHTVLRQMAATSA